MIRLKSLIVLCLIFNGAHGFLPTKLDFSDPDLDDIFCDVSGPTTYHKAITREGIRREIRELFLEEPPVDSTDFTIPEDATLSELFHLYYGQESSATRFYKAVNTISWANADLDSMESTKYDARLHFDGEMLAEGQISLGARHNAIVSSLIANQSYDFSRQQIGYSLHTIQDFYSHTNWIELGNDEILDNLGIPGFNIPNVADISDAVCSDCVSTDGTCVGNDILSDKLTSGYYEYDVTQAASSIVNKPTNSGKCSHGGTLDSSRTQPATGGINKASASSCFSPHSYLHDTATELATMATERYLHIIRSTIGNEKFRLLFDLYQGSALVIVIDTTGSMGDEIQAVKDEVALIVATAPAELYILVPYNDPSYGPMTKTTDSQIFLDAVNDLSARGGNAPLEEYVWSGLNLALVNTPDYSNLYLFTDAGGYDYLLMDGDFALAQDKNIICTTVFSYENGAFSGPPYTDDTDYQRLAKATGGDFIIIDEFSIEDIISILGDSINSSVVSLALRRDETGAISFDALVDDTVSVLEITISGEVDTATVTDPNGVVVDLKDRAALDNIAYIVVNAYSNTLMDIRFEEPEIGYWTIDASSSGIYSVTADGFSTLDYLVDFTELDMRPPRPNYKLINGQPIASLIYYVEITLVAWIENEVIDVYSMDFLDEHGNVLSHVDNTAAVDYEFYIQSEPLPNQPFFVAVSGHLSSGNEFTRLYETLITPSDIAVTVDLAKSVLASPPDTTSFAIFTVRNFGDDSDYTFFATDEKSYVSAFFPSSSFILSGEEQTVNLTIYVPPEAVPWTESTIIVTASSEVDSAIVNSDLAYFIVLPEDRDLTAPSCVATNVPSCQNFNSATNCDELTWIATATMSDSDSGLSTIYTQPSTDDTDLDIPGFVSGTTDDIEATFTASCCVREAQIIGVDLQGNIGVCSYDLGPLDGVLTFEAIDEGTTWIYLTWTVSDVRIDLYKYTVLVDNGFSNDIACFDLVCYFNATRLAPCRLHHFELTPYFDEFQNTTLIAGSTAETDDSTLDRVPDPPINAETSSDSDFTKMDLTWDAPVDSSCIILYEVCYSITDDEMAIPSCLSTSDTSAVLTEMEPCSVYTIQINSLTITGLESEVLEITAISDDATPGAPTDLIVYNTTLDTATITWNRPIVYPQCVAKYDVRWIETAKLPPNLKIEPEKDHEIISAFVEQADGEFMTIISPLLSCTNYTFEVFAVSHDDLTGPGAIAYGETDETEPSNPTNFNSDGASTSSIYTSWNAGADICVGFYDLCFEDPVSETENCTEVTGTEHLIEGLRSCTGYIMTLAAVSPNGEEGTDSFSIATTLDEVPGAPQNLIVSDVTSNTVTVTFEPPVENPQCIDRYFIKYIDMYTQNLLSEQFDGKTAKVGSSLELTGINSCTEVWIMVSAVSPSGLEGPFANTTTTTSEADPSIPQNLVVIGTSSTTLTISWFVPADNERCIEFYRVITISDAGQSAFSQVLSDPFTVRYTHILTDLETDMGYEIIVEGVTSLGGNQGAAATTSGQTLPA